MGKKVYLFDPKEGKMNAKSLILSVAMGMSLMVKGEQTWAKNISVNGIEPNKTTITNNTYPYVSEIYAAVRSDIDKTSTAYKLFKYLTTSSGQNVVKESGYVPVAK